MIKNLLIMLFSIVWALPALADDFNPDLPPEPNALYQIVTKATPVGNTSGTGSYREGETVFISTSNVTGYVFSHWNKNGERYSTEQSFSYTVEANNNVIVFEAVWHYNPTPPSEPQSYNQYRLYLENNYADACSFNRESGDLVEADDYVNVTAYKSEAYEFEGWYQDGQLITKELSFNFQMPFANATLMAKFVYAPKLPGEPGDPDNPQDDVANGKLGDVTGDSSLNVTDAVELINAILADKTATLNKAICDVNKDSLINVSDAVEIINIILKGK